MNVVKLNGVKVYNLTSERSMPEWASRAEKRKLLKADPGIATHIELIHELEMPDASTYITCSPDQQFLFLLGRYKPRVKCYELRNLSLKFDRCVDYLPLKMTCLSDDFSKFALMEDERWIDVHAAGGHHFRFRIPKQGTDITYTPFKCHLLTASCGNAIYRMDMNEGRFDTPLISPEISESNGLNACCHLPELDVLLAASTEGKVDGWDLRSGDRTFSLDVCSSAPRPSELTNFSRMACSSLAYKDPLNFAVGTSEGIVHIYDVRQNKSPWHTRDTEYRNPVKTISFHDDKILAIVSHCLKIWYIDSGKMFVGFETGPIALNWMYHFPLSGLVMLANESPKVSRYFIPLLGEAPYWCSYLDQLIVECEPDVKTMYDGYKFLTRQQLLEFGMLDLIGTRFLRAYMHGYFVSTQLFNKVQAKLGLTELSAVSKADVSSDLAISDLSKEDKKRSNIQELEEAFADPRFAKLKDPKLASDVASSDSDLIRIHQSRLEKKRRRKEFRKAKAVRANLLVQSEQENC